MQSNTLSFLGPEIVESDLKIGKVNDSLAQWRLATKDAPYVGNLSDERTRFTFPHDFTVPSDAFFVFAKSDVPPTDQRTQSDEEALRWAKFMVAWSPKSANYWTNLGAVHYRLENWEPAIEAMERAMTFTDEIRASLHGEQYLVLAISNWKLGHRAKGRELYELAIRWIVANGPPDDELNDYLSRAITLFDMALN